MALAVPWMINGFSLLVRTSAHGPAAIFSMLKIEIGTMSAAMGTVAASPKLTWSPRWKAIQYRISA